MTTSAHNPNKLLSEAGFTLVEMLVALVVALLGMSAILVADLGQHQSYNAQLQIADARQKARSVIAILRSDLVMATTFTAAAQTSFAIVRVDGVPVTYSLAVDGNGVGQLQRREGAGSLDVFAEGIDGLEFRYLNNNGAPAPLNNIPIVAIAVVSRASGIDPRFRDGNDYRILYDNRAWPQANLNSGPLTDNFHRKFWTETVVCRNQQQE